MHLSGLNMLWRNCKRNGGFSVPLQPHSPCVLISKPWTERLDVISVAFSCSSVDAEHKTAFGREGLTVDIGFDIGFIGSIPFGGEGLTKL